MARNRHSKNYSMKERISYHEGRSKAGGKRGAYSAGYVKGARTAASRAKNYYGGNKGGKA